MKLVQKKMWKKELALASTEDALYKFSSKYFLRTANVI